MAQHTPDEITNSADVIDSRDVIARIEYLESERADFESPEVSAADLADPALAVDDRPAQSWEDASPDEAAELAALKALADEAEGYAPDWRHGAPLIRHSYFTDYCRELVEDCDGLPKNLPSYIAGNINWDGVADDLKVDYTEVDFAGVAYYVR